MSYPNPSDIQPDSKLKILVASPCNEDWDAMTGSEKERHCARCKRNVFNLSAMSQIEIDQLMQQDGRKCVRFYQRKDGTVITQDCPIGLRIRRRMKFTALIVVGFLSFGYYSSRSLANTSHTNLGSARLPSWDECLDTAAQVPLLKDVVNYFYPYRSTMIMGEMVVVSPPVTYPAPTSTP